VRLRPLLDLCELFHQLGVDVQAARGVDDEHVALLCLRSPERPLGDLYRVAVRALLVHRRPGLLSDLHELINGGGPVDVAGRQRHVLLLLLAQVARELRAGGGLARPL
jgi:hypothetical protein